MNVILESGKFTGTLNEFSEIVNNILYDNYLLPATLLILEDDDLAFNFTDIEEYDCIPFKWDVNERGIAVKAEDMVLRSDAAIIFCNGDLHDDDSIVPIAQDWRIDIWLYYYNLKSIVEI